MRRRAAILAFLIVVASAGLLAAYFGLRPIPLDTEEHATSAKHEATTTAEEADAASPRSVAEGTGTEAGQQKSDLSKVEIDVARISRDGSSVFAGRSEPNTYVTVFDGDKPVGSVKADEGGDWSMITEHKFAGLDPKLSYRSTREPPPQIAAPAAGTEAVAQASESRAAAAKPEESTKAPRATPAQEVSAELLKKFEGMVAEAREEAKKTATGPALAPAGPPQSAEAPRQAAAPTSHSVTPQQPLAQAQPPTSAGIGPPVTGSAVPKPETSADAGSKVAEAARAPAHKAETRASPRASASAATTPAPASPPAEASHGNAPPAAPAVAAAEPQRTPDKATANEPAPSSSSEEVSIPVPIMFVYNEANFTDDGRRAADLLLEYLMLKHARSVTLSGHADERGSDEYNIDLSRERLEAVERYLQAGGFTGALNLMPKGKREPFMGVDRTKYAGEALFQLDRRVELRLLR